ncbi:hypothetical protein B0H12DRAFT_1245989 [Mycena haematopus]|nr:hypothetical protein B0H12DRAFT_1245989 [Mycena haematopus]
MSGDETRPESYYESAFIYGKVPSLKSTVPMTSHKFWEVIGHNRSSRSAARNVLACSNTKSTTLKPSEAADLLMDLLSPLRFAISELDLQEQIPDDVMLFLAHLFVVLAIAAKAEKPPRALLEFNGLSYPNLKKFPIFDESFEIPIPEIPVSSRLLSNAPRLDRPMPKRKREPTPISEDEIITSVSAKRMAPRPPTKKPKKEEEQTKPLSLNSSAESSGQEDEPPARTKTAPAKGSASASALSKPSRTTRSGQELRTKDRVSYTEPADSEEEDEKPKRGRNTKNKERGKSILQGSASSPYVLTLVHRTGNAIYRPRNNLGPGDPKDYKELPRLDFQPRFNLPIGEALLPHGPCSFCILYGIDCSPNGIGLGCGHCVLKKIGHLCDHSSNAGKLQHVFAKLQDNTGILTPHAGVLNLELLCKVARRTATTQELAKQDREAFAELLRQFLTNAHELNVLLGTQGFESLYSADTRPVIRQSLNYFIDWFNKSLNPSLPDPVIDPAEGSDSQGEDDEDEGDPATSPTRLATPTL